MTTYDSPGALVRTFIDLLVANQPDAACAMASDDCEYDNVPMGKVFGPSIDKSKAEPLPMELCLMSEQIGFN